MNHRTPARIGSTLGIALGIASALSTLALLDSACFVDAGNSGTSDSDPASATITAGTASTTGTAGTASTAGTTGAASMTGAVTSGPTTSALTTTEASTAGETTGTGEETTDASTTSATTNQTSATETTDGTTDDTGGAACDENSPMLAMTTTPVQGADLTSRAIGDELCVSEFGEGWQWLDFHYQSQWKVEGQWLNGDGEGERGWVIILDNNGNCLESTHGMTWYRAPGSCSANCLSSEGLDGPNFMPHGPDDVCNPYGGDTPCELARPLVCVLAG